MGRLVSARHLWRQRALLPPQPVPPKDSAATSVAQAAWDSDLSRVHSLLSEADKNVWGNDVLLAPLARATCDILRERCVQQLARAYVRVSGGVLATVLGIAESELPKLANMGWTQDSGGYLCPPPQQKHHQSSSGAAEGIILGAIPPPAEQVSMLADQLIRLQTTG